jgi:hypothetical protein
MFIKSIEPPRHIAENRKAQAEISRQPNAEGGELIRSSRLGLGRATLAALITAERKQKKFIVFNVF